MKRAKVSELKARLSSYLADVRSGATVLVCDRNTPIARLVPSDEPTDVQIREPIRAAAELRRLRGVRPRGPVDVTGLLRLDRDQR
jgi:prevent-host-death family protein